MSWDTQLAREFRKRENPKPIGACIGTVTSVKPFAGSILDGQILLDPSNTYICNQLLERKSQFELSGTQQQSGSLSASCGYGSHNSYSANGNITLNGEVTLNEVLQVGDMVLVLPAANEQMFFIIDIIKGVG